MTAVVNSANVGTIGSVMADVVVVTGATVVVIGLAVVAVVNI